MPHTETVAKEHIAEMVDLIVDEPHLADYTVNEISGGGPKHKQELSALLIARILELVRLTERRTGNDFAPQDGFEFTTGKEEVPVLPVLMPIHAEPHADLQILADQIAQGPEHELLAFALSLQGLEWVISQTEEA